MATQTLVQIGRDNQTAGTIPDATVLSAPGFPCTRAASEPYTPNPRPSTRPRSLITSRMVQNSPILLLRSSGLPRGFRGAESVLSRGFVSKPQSALGGVPRQQKMLKGHLPRVIYHQVYKYTKIKGFTGNEGAAWMAGKENFPMLSSFVNPKHPRA